MSGDPVATQYEAYPYPARNPRDERRRLVEGSPSHLDEVAHYVFAGRLPQGRPLRALVAGGGTGDGLIMLVQHAVDRGVAAEIVYLDLSQASRAIAEARARERGLTSIRFLQGSILDIATLAPGPFDYIDCCGVLHHLPDPLAGLRALAGVMDPAGGMGLMLYAPYGREGVYPLQSALRRLAGGQAPRERLALARHLLDGLPPTNGFLRNPWLGDHRASDAGLYDLLLHDRDRPYTVGEMAALVDAAGLEIASFIQPVRYRPDTYVKQPRLLAQIRALPPLEQAALAEELVGNIKVHVAYVVAKGRAAAAVADPGAPGLCPVLAESGMPEWARAVRPGSALTLDMDGVPLRLTLPRLTGAILSHVDGKTPIPDLYRAVVAAGARDVSFEAFQGQFAQLYAALNGVGKLYLRRP